MIFLLSLLVPEAFGITAIEAMARGVIVLANQQDSLSEFMVHQETGFFYDADNPQSLPNLIYEIKDQKYDLVQIRKNATRWSKPVFMHQNNWPDLRKSLKRPSRTIP